jgi:hypothetical protein
MSHVKKVRENLKTFKGETKGLFAFKITHDGGIRIRAPACDTGD